jgi:hypothetical protein
VVSLRSCWSNLGRQGDAIQLADIAARHFVFLVDQAWRPTPVVLAVLDAVEDLPFTTIRLVLPDP